MRPARRSAGYVDDNTSGQHDADDQRLARREAEGLGALLDLWQTGELARRVKRQKGGDEDTDDDSGLADLRGGTARARWWPVRTVSVEMTLDDDAPC